MYELRHGQRLGPVRPGPVTGPVLITGGAGFVGTSLAHRLLSGGESVVVLDNLSRPGVELNVKWLRGTHPAGVRVEVADVRDEAAVTRAVAEAGVVFHLPPAAVDLHLDEQGVRWAGGHRAAAPPGPLRARGQ